MLVCPTPLYYPLASTQFFFFYNSRHGKSVLRASTIPEANIKHVGGLDTASNMG